MADQQVGNIHGVTAAHIGSATQKTNISGDNSTPQDGYFDADTTDIQSMRARLAVIDAGYYTADVLNNMTYNDMLYAIRTADAAATIKQ